VEPPIDSGIIKLYPLKYADAQRVSTMLGSLLTQGLYKPALVSAATNAIARAREKVAITTDLRTNVLIVSGSKENLNVIDQIIKSVDVQEGWGLTGNIQIYPLKNADATRLAPTLQQMFDRKLAAERTLAGGQARSLAVVVIPDERTNSLLVAAGKEDSESVAKMLETLDVSDVTRTYDFRVFYLKHATATALEPSLRTLMSQRPARGLAPTPVTISSNPKLNALIVAASRDDLAAAESLIAKLDVPTPEEGMTMQAFAAGKGDSLQLAKTLQSLYDAQKAPGAPSSVIFTADERSNTIFASAPKAEMANITAQIEKLVNGQMNADAAEIRIFGLKHADATQLATILNDALTNKPKAITPISQYRATLVQFFAESADGKKLLSAIKEGVMVTPVARTNSLLVQAPLDAMPLLDKLIEALDLADPRSAEIKVFTLINADATQMARLLSELFRIQIASTARQAARYAYGSADEAAGGAASRPAADLGATFGAAEQNALSITIDPRTNSLLVAGTREYIELVGKVVTDLDASPAEDRQTMVYRLRNTKATDIETALKTFIAGERTLLTGTLTNAGVGNLQELLARQVQVVAVPDTHAGVTEKDSSTLLVSGSPRFFKTVEAIIRELDQPPPQVLIDVLLAEVKLDDTTEFGVQWNLLGHPEKGPAVGSGTKFNLGSAGFNFTVSSGDFDLLLRALQRQGRLEVLSRPQILAIDNVLSRINVGDRVPFVTNSRIDVNGGVFNTIQYQDVGIILEVTPRINPDGFVKLQVAPEISSLSTSSVQISEGVSAPIINTRQAKTTVTVLDGHSIVIGGLITNKDEAREDKVPVLGDIPLLGLLFKSSKVTKERTELLIILTPRVQRTSTQADVLTNRQVRALQLVRSIHSDSGIGQVLNPLRGVSPEEVEQLESGKSAPPAPGQPVLIPLTPAKRESPTTTPAAQ
jgi:type II secretion system protein D